MGRERKVEAVSYYIELKGKWPKSRPRFMEVIGWAIAQPNVGDPSKEVWYSGGGPWIKKDSEVFCSLGDHYGPYKGVVPKFVQNNHYAAVFTRKERAEEVAVLMAVKHTELVGRLYLSAVTRLGPVSKDAKVCQKTR